MILGAESMMCATGDLGSGVEVVGLGVAEGVEAEGGADGERRVREGGLAKAMAQKGQDCL